MMPNEIILTKGSSECSPLQERRGDYHWFQFTRKIMCTKGYDNAYENVREFLEFLNASLLEWFNFPYVFKIILKMLLSPPNRRFSVFFASLCASSENPSIVIASSAFPSRQIFNRIILYIQLGHLFHQRCFRRSPTNLKI